MKDAATAAILTAEEVADLLRVSRPSVHKRLGFRPTARDTTDIPC
jgi:hypothetical protein